MLLLRLLGGKEQAAKEGETLARAHWTGTARGCWRWRRPAWTRCWSSGEWRVLPLLLLLRARGGDPAANRGRSWRCCRLRWTAEEGSLLSRPGGTAPCWWCCRGGEEGRWPGLGSADQGWSLSRAARGRGAATVVRRRPGLLVTWICCWGWAVGGGAGAGSTDLGGGGRALLRLLLAPGEKVGAAWGRGGLVLR